jgi:hypothetical protein
MDNFREYHERAKEYAEEWGESPSEHIIGIMASVMMTRDDVLQGGGFVQSIVENNLYLSINRADNECLKYMKLIVNTNQHCYLEE